MKFKIFSLTGLALLLLLTIHPKNGQQVMASNWPEMTDVWLTADDFQDWSTQGFTVSADGVRIGDERQTAVYQSPTLTAPIPFNAVVPQWTVTLPPETDIEIEVRTKKFAGQWGNWLPIHSHADWDLADDPATVGEMISVPARDTTHRHLQFKLILHQNQSPTSPTFHQIQFTYIDTTFGPTVDELIAQQTALNREEAGRSPDDNYPKPFVISRDVWCDHPDCNYSNGLQYEPVTHLIVHHTVSGNGIVDWLAHLRAVWSYHTFTLGWGDIGYNYLVDPNGVLYEGHIGGDDVVGTHAAIANRGTMALAFLGTFETTTPSDPMLEAAAELFAWKADQKDIDVYDASGGLPEVPWGLPNLMGHRDVYGGLNTACPGSICHSLLPLLRDEVADRLGQISPYIYVDELSDNFIKSTFANWYTAGGQCGHNLHGYFTWSTTDPAQSANWGEWYPEIPEDGRYQIQAYAPYCNTGGPETDGATYEIHHAQGTDTVIVSQNDLVGTWFNLGEYELLADGSNYVYLSDLTDSDDGRGIWFDALRLLPLDPVQTNATNEMPLDDSWLNQLSVDFQWQISNPTSVITTELQVAMDEAFNHIALSQQWPNAVTNYTNTFAETDENLYWRVQLTTEEETIISEATRFHVDVISPTSTISLLAWSPLWQQYVLYWDGLDDVSGIDHYNIEMRTAVTNTWQPFLTATSLKSIQFSPLLSDTVWFRIQAVDVAGNIEPVHTADTGDINTSQAISLTHDIMLTIVKRN